MQQQAAASLKKIRYEVRRILLGVPTDPTADVVQFGFRPLADGPVPPASVVSGAWETANGRYYATCLVGPGGAYVPTAGQYTVWLKITDAPEIPYDPVDLLTIT